MHNIMPPTRSLRCRHWKKQLTAYFLSGTQIKIRTSECTMYLRDLMRLLVCERVDSHSMTMMSHSRSTNTHGLSQSVGGTTEPLNKCWLVPLLHMKTLIYTVVSTVIIGLFQHCDGQ